VIFLVSHFHWDREWYRTFDEFRARLVDAIDAVLDQLDADPGFRFVLDGQAIVLEDYLEIRPHQRERIAAGIRARRLGAGPWYVQPDSLLPGGEAHVRNLLHGTAVVREFGEPSHVAYVPDSFGHPAQFPQLFAGFGLDPFIYWRGNGNELDALGPVYRWRAPDGSVVRAWHLTEGYFAAGGLDADGDVDATVTRLKSLIDRLPEPVLLMNGFDHLPADTTTREVAEAVGAQRALLDDAAAELPSTTNELRGELMGARITNLLPGVWSSRMPLKLRNRKIETLLTAWAEPWTAFARLQGLPDEQPALTRAWRTLLCNQAHDSIGGCSIDAVHERMLGRYDDAEGIARATTQRTLERLAGVATTRQTPWREQQDVVVFNASPEPRTDIVRIPLDGFPPWRLSVTRFDFHPLGMPTFNGLTIDGEPVRVVRSDDPARPRFLAEVGGLDAEFVARDVPAFGSRRYTLTPADATPDAEDEGVEIAGASANPDGTLNVGLFRNLFGIEDMIDLGDSYDADAEPRECEIRTTSIRRERHPSGIERLTTTREIEDVGTLTVEVIVAPGVPFVRCHVTLDNRATDHRLRLRFPTGAPIESFDAATTFDTAHRVTEPRDDAGWVHPAPRTFPHQGWIAANGLVVCAPGLPEAEVTPDGDILVTLVRSVGSLAKLSLRTRPQPAAPEMPAPGAQMQGLIRATVTIATTAQDARAAEVGLWGVFGNVAPPSFLALESERCELSSCKPAEDGDGIIVRLLNPTDEPDTAAIRFGFPVADIQAVRLDESPVDLPDPLVVPPHALRTIRVRPSSGTT
jgi:alpha-mannosidase